jgi:hypothetical protein
MARSITSRRFAVSTYPGPDREWRCVNTLRHIEDMVPALSLTIDMFCDFPSQALSWGVIDPRG